MRLLNCCSVVKFGSQECFEAQKLIGIGLEGGLS